MEECRTADDESAFAYDIFHYAKPSIETSMPAKSGSNPILGSDPVPTAAIVFCIVFVRNQRERESDPYLRGMYSLVHLCHVNRRHPTPALPSRNHLSW